MSKLTNCALAIGCFISSAFQVSGQYYFYNPDYYDAPILFEFGSSAGGMNCLTDLGGKKGIGKKFIKDLNWNQTNLCGGMFATVIYQEMFAARIDVTFGGVKANDDVLGNDRSAAYGRSTRHLNFRSGIAEASLGLEVNPALLFQEYNSRLSPFVLIGIGLFRFCPQAYQYGSWINLSGLHTEGEGFYEYPERKQYSLTQMNMPMGAGVKFEPSAALALRFEIICRKLWTDYLDDVSNTYIDPEVFQHYFTPALATLARRLADRRENSASGSRNARGEKRGNNQDNDAYFSFNLKIGLVLGRQVRK